MGFWKKRSDPGQKNASNMVKFSFCAKNIVTAEVVQGKLSPGMGTYHGCPNMCPSNVLDLLLEPCEENSRDTSQVNDSSFPILPSMKLT